MSTKYTIITIISSIIYFFTCLTTISLMFFSACGLTIYFIYKTQTANSQTIDIDGYVSFTATSHVYATVSLEEESDTYNSFRSVDIETHQQTFYDLTLNPENSPAKVKDEFYQCEIIIFNNSVVTDLYVTVNNLPTIGVYNSYFTIQYFKNGTEFTSLEYADETVNCLDTVAYKVVIAVAENANITEIDELMLGAPLYIGWDFNLSPQI